MTDVPKPPDATASKPWWKRWWGIALIAFGGIGLALVGVALIAAPHLYGAPHLDTYYGVAPPELAAHFATRSLSVAAASWVILGTLAGFFWSREA